MTKNKRIKVHGEKEMAIVEEVMISLALGFTGALSSTP